MTSAHGEMNGPKGRQCADDVVKNPVNLERAAFCPSKEVPPSKTVGSSGMIVPWKTEEYIYQPWVINQAGIPASELRLNRYSSKQSYARINHGPVDRDGN
ncbi:hypothetical protein DTO169C6_7825 [Paecilomyces variotii]|nr:hypothetical protein DTO169C6_7825 [Paecilomyces variotii]KAJ9389151.1 hypothetical protein DTO063F5_2311 [Paecilomyces variotii]